MNLNLLQHVAGSFLCLSLSLAAISCQDETRINEKKYENYGDIYAEDQSLLTNPSNHPHGYGKKNCFQCHNVQNIHQVDLILSLDVDLNSIHSRIAEDGLSSCQDCHGNNGTYE